jgi:hypothetical protein
MGEWSGRLSRWFFCVSKEKNNKNKDLNSPHHVLLKKKKDNLNASHQVFKSFSSSPQKK